MSLEGFSLKRRTFLGSASALIGSIGLPLLGSSSGASSARTAAPIVVVDARLSGAAAFGAQMRGRDLQTYEFAGGDVGRVWFEGLEPSLRASPDMALIGLTAHAPLECLQIMAMAQRRANLLRIDQYCLEDCMEYRLHMSPRYIPAFESELRASGHRSAAYFALVAAAARTPLGISHALHRLRVRRPAALGEDSVVWVIAPPRTAGYVEGLR
jgi:hypothetical protein